MFLFSCNVMQTITKELVKMPGRKLHYRNLVDIEKKVFDSRQKQPSEVPH